MERIERTKLESGRCKTLWGCALRLDRPVLQGCLMNNACRTGARLLPAHPSPLAAIPSSGTNPPIQLFPNLERKEGDKMVDGQDRVMAAYLTSQPFTSRRSKTGSRDGPSTS